MVSVSKTALGSVFLLVFVDFMQMSFLFPLFPKISENMNQTWGLTNEMRVGILGSVGALGEGLAAPWLGALADRIGRKPVFIASLVGTTISTIVTGFTTEFAPLVLARLVNGVSGGTASVAAAYIGDCTTMEERAIYMTYFQAAIFAGLSFGPAIGGVINNLYSYQMVCWVAAVISASATVAIVFFVTESRTPEERAATLGHAVATNVKLPFKAYLIFAANFLQGVGFTCLESLATIFAQDQYYNGDVEQATNLASVTISLLGVVGLFTNLFIYSRIIPLTGLKGSIVFGGLVSATGFFLVGIPVNPTYFVLVIQLFIFGENILGTSVQTIITFAVHPSMFGKAFGIMTLCMNSARALGPFLFTPLYGLDLGSWGKLYWSHSLVWFLNAFIKLLTVAVILFVDLTPPAAFAPTTAQAADEHAEAESAAEAAAGLAMQKQVSRLTSTGMTQGGMGLVRLASAPGGRRTMPSRTVSLQGDSSPGASMQEKLVSDGQPAVRMQSVP